MIKKIIQKIKTPINNKFVSYPVFEKETRYLREEIEKLHKRNQELEEIFSSLANDHQKQAELYKTVIEDLSNKK
ncbi:MAG: hypothetical protein LBT91_01130 [Bifidobacteriaceae bacterium]|jgi:hypothetical protein|nr:hypothetical protein [Bifidobacteriaceae bacterium]